MNLESTGRLAVLMLASVACAPLVSGAALSAEALSISAEPAVVDWSGVQFSAFGSFGWGDESDDFDVPHDVMDSFPIEGRLAGVGLGMDFQTNGIVFGVIGDVALSNLEGGTSTEFETIEGLGVSTLSFSSTWEASLRARLGFAVEQILFYGTAGLATAGGQSSFTAFIPEEGDWSGDQYATLFGWTAGAGVAFALDKNWSAGAELRYTDFGDAKYSYAPGMDGPETYKAGFSSTALNFTLGYRF